MASSSDNEPKSLVDLPVELFEETCYLLPAKSIRILHDMLKHADKKSWREVIRTPPFTKNHFTKFENPLNSVSFIVGRNPFNCLTLNSADHQVHNDDITVSVESLNLQDCPEKFTQVFTSCDGLVLVGNNNKHELLINPITREFKKVREIPFPESARLIMTRYGLGYDSVTDDYKIVAIVSFLNNPMSVYIYSVINDSWNECSTFSDLGLELSFRSSGVFVNKHVHWMAKRTANNSHVIVAVNLEDREFSELVLPELIGQSQYSYQLCVLDGCFCIAGEFKVWKMMSYGDENSWTLLAEYEPQYEGVSYTPLCLLEQKNLILWKSDGYAAKYRDLVAYNLQERTFRDVVKYDDNAGSNISTAFVDTLVSPYQRD